MEKDEEEEAERILADIKEGKEDIKQVDSEAEADSTEPQQVKEFPLEDKESEGVDKLSDIPKGKEKNYGI